MIKEVRKIRNGNALVDYYIFKCDSCGSDIEESWPHIQPSKGTHICTDCAFKTEQIDEKEYLASSGFLIDSFHAAVDPEGKIKIWQGSKTPAWVRSESKQRNTPEYADWREKVFESDNYTCQVCGQCGGELTAHHIKSFKNHPELRTDVNNGVTLCLECHKEQHRNSRKKGLNE